MTLLARPDHIVEAAFFENDDGLVWVNLTDDVELSEGIKAGKRRQNVFDNVAPATFAVSFDNTTGKFNNDKSDSPYVGMVTLDVPVRFRVRWPNCPDTTANMLSDYQSLANDASQFTADQGFIAVDENTDIQYSDDPEDSVVYSGAWSSHSHDDYFGGTEQYSSTLSASATCTFVGTYISYYGSKKNDRGIASITIDGTSYGTVDCYAASETWFTKLFEQSGLSPGTHTIVITNTHTKNGSSSNYYVCVDAFGYQTVASPPSGQTADIVWNTGVLDTTGVSVLTGDGPTRSPDDHPIYVKPSTTYSARLVARDDANGTGISFAVKARIRWFDIEGEYISDTDGSPVTLTTSYQNVTATGTSPSNAATARFGIVSNTIVGPTAQAITFDGSDERTQSWGKSLKITIPQSVRTGDVVLAFVRTNNTAVTVTPPAGWTVPTPTSGSNPWSDGRGKTHLSYRIVTASDIGKGYTWTTSANCGFQIMLSVYNGNHLTTPIHKLTTSTETVYRTTHTTGNVTTTSASCWIVSAAFDVSSTTTLWGAPGGETVRTVAYRTGGNSPTGIISDDATAHAAGTYGTKTFTANSSSMFASMATLAIAPATGTGPGTVAVQMGKFEFVAGSLSTWAEGGHWESKFTGLVDDWEETFSGDLTLMACAATDRQKILNSIDIESAIYETIKAAGPVAYYKLDESSTGTKATQEAANSSDYPQDTLKQKNFGTVADATAMMKWGEGVGPAIDGTAALMTVPTDNNNGVGLYSLATTPVVNGNAFSIVLFFRSSTLVAQYRTLAKFQSPTNGVKERGYIEIRADSTYHLQANARIVSEGVDIQETSTSTSTYFNGLTHCVVATVELVGGQMVSTLYVDGEVVGTPASGATTIGQFPTFSALSVGTAGNVAYLCAGTYSHAAFFDYALDADTISDINTAGTTAFAGDTVDERIGRLVSWENQSDLDLDTSTTITARHMPEPQSLQSAIQQAASSGGGTAYIGGNGEIKFLSRLTKELVADPLITVTAQEVEESAFKKATNDELLVNRPVVKRLDTQVTFALIDQDSKDIHGTHEKEFETILSSDADARNFATYVLAFYGEPKQRCEQVNLEGLTLQDWANVILIDMWQIIRITGMPTVEQNSTLDLYIEGWEINITPDSWGITFDTSTATPFGIVNDDERGVCGAAVVGW